MIETPTPLFSNLNPRRICLIKPSALGDIVQTLPVLPILQERFPAARISWVVASQFANLLEGHPCLDELILFNRRGSVLGFLKLLNSLRKRRFDLVFDLQGLFRTGLMTWATGAPVRVGLETAREASHLACNYQLPNTNRHVPAHLRAWQVAEALGLGGRVRETTIPVTAEDRMWADRQLAGLPPYLLAIHAGAQWETKRWPPGQFAYVASKAARRYGLSTVLVGSKSERPITEEIEKQLRKFVPSARVLNLAGETSLKQLAAVLAKAEAVLSNDSGPMHMAAGLGRPVVGVFTCTDPRRSGPPGDEHALISTGVSCAGSYRKRCPYRGANHLACLKELEAERVWAALAKNVEREREQRRAA